MAIIVRRTGIPVQKKYQLYKAYLRVDFHYSCAYCGIHENEFGGIRHFHVEHYRPQVHFPGLVLDYENLFYACGICNSFKRADWPSDNPLDDGIGYLDPCQHDYLVHFKENDNAILEHLSPPALYMIERLHLNRMQLIKLRSFRQREAQQHSALLTLYETAISKIATQLARQDLDDKARDALKCALPIIKYALANRLENWSKRSHPIHEETDYR